MTCDICGRSAKLEKAVGSLFPWRVCDLCDLKIWSHYFSFFHEAESCRFCVAAEITSNETLGG